MQLVYLYTRYLHRRIFPWVIYLTDALPGAKYIGLNMPDSLWCRLFQLGVISLIDALLGAKYIGRNMQVHIGVVYFSYA